MAPFGLVLGLLLVVLAVVRGVSDDVRAYGRLSEGTANLVAAAFLLDAMVVFIAAAGHVVPASLPEPLALMIGLPLLVGGLVVAGAACRALGSRERLLGMRLDTVVTSSAYGISRHPFYLGWSLTLIGAAIAGQSWFAIVLATVSALFLVLLARREERFLAERMSDTYSSYQQGTRGLVGRRSVTPKSRAQA